MIYDILIRMKQQSIPHMPAMNMVCWATCITLHFGRQQKCRNKLLLFDLAIGFDTGAFKNTIPFRDA
jgi:hypothetical protein